jgi:hypothetical protein
LQVFALAMSGAQADWFSDLVRILADESRSSYCAVGSEAQVFLAVTVVS